MDEGTELVVETIRQGAKELAGVIDAFCADGANKVVALGRLRQSMDAAIKAAYEQDTKTFAREHVTTAL